MSFPISEVLALALQCAPSVAPETLLSIVKVESGFNALAIGVNGSPQLRIAADTPAAALAQARGLLARGRNIDLGLAQINSANLGWLALSVADALDPCRNLGAAERVLGDGYRRARATGAEPQAALRTALSYYNTGHPRRGFANGYVAKVDRAARAVVPALRATQPTSTLDPAELPSTAAPVATWDVFAKTRRDVFAAPTSIDTPLRTAP